MAAFLKKGLKGLNALKNNKQLNMLKNKTNKIRDKFKQFNNLNPYNDITNNNQDIDNKPELDNIISDNKDEVIDTNTNITNNIDEEKYKIIIKEIFNESNKINEYIFKQIIDDIDINSLTSIVQNNIQNMINCVFKCKQLKIILYVSLFDDYVKKIDNSFYKNEVITFLKKVKNNLKINIENDKCYNSNINNKKIKGGNNIDEEKTLLIQNINELLKNKSNKLNIYNFLIKKINTNLTKNKIIEQLIKPIFVNLSKNMILENNDNFDMNVYTINELYNDIDIQKFLLEQILKYTYNTKYTTKLNNSNIIISLKNVNSKIPNFIKCIEYFYDNIYDNNTITEYTNNKITELTDNKITESTDNKITELTDNKINKNKLLDNFKNNKLLDNFKNNKLLDNITNKNKLFNNFKKNKLFNNITNKNKIFDNLKNNKLFNNITNKNKLFDNLKNNKIFNNITNKNKLFNNITNKNKIFDNLKNKNKIFDNLKNNKIFNNIINKNKTIKNKKI